MADLDVLLASRNLSLAPYLGFATVRGLINDSVASSGTPQQIKARMMDIVRYPMSYPRPVFAVGWYVNSSGVEVVQAGAYQVQMAIEWPIGTTPQRLTFGGQLTLNCNGGDTIIADAPATAVPLKRGDRPAFHVWENSPSGWCYHNNPPASAGDDILVGASVADLSVSYLPGKSAPGSAGIALLGVVDTITQAADLDIGDSLVQGSDKEERDANMAFGMMARMTRGRFGGCNAGRSSTLINQFTAANRSRTIALKQYVTRVKLGGPVNDCLNSIPAPTTVTELIRVRNLFSDKEFFLGTVPPIVTGGTTLQDRSDQVVGTPGTIATTLNTSIRAGLVVSTGGNSPSPLVTGVLDVRNVLQSPLNEQHWEPGMCVDTSDPRVHPKGVGFRRVGETCPGRGALF